MKKELIKSWNRDGYSVRLYYTGKRDSYEKDVLSYRFADNKSNVIFTGDDFGVSPLHAIDSITNVYALLDFMSLQLGDTDKEYFDSYTPEQFAWMESSRCEELSYLIPDKYR